MKSAERPTAMQSSALILVALLLTLCCWNWNQLWAQDAPAEQVTVALALINEGALVIDVRSPEEFESGHLDGALNIAHTDIDALAEAIGDFDQPVVLYCGSGKRAGKAKTTLESRGYTAVVNGLGYKDLSVTQY